MVEVKLASGSSADTGNPNGSASWAAQFCLGLFSIGLLCLATGLPGGMPDTSANELALRFASRGFSGWFVRLLEFVVLQRLWIGLGLVLLGGIGDHYIGMRRLADVVEDRVGLLKFLAISVQLAIVVWVCRRFQLEHGAFSGVFLFLTATGFFVHHLLPPNLRLPFFVFLSLTTYVMVLGWRDGLFLLGFGVVLIAFARLPVALLYRMILILSLVLGLIYVRASGWNAPWSDAIWTILWSMFLFRMIIYLFDMRHGKAPTEWKHALAYFFLLPNVVFPLFPPVDYASLWRNYYQGDPFKTYQTGVYWMLVGVVHLLVYRYIDYYWIESPEVIISSKAWIQYVVANYLLIIRLSGQFHLIVGILHLFGFGLPRCMDHYFLSSGFTDYWRRVNIYWKDFIQKVVYYPAFFRMRELGNTTKIVIATLLGFLATWLFHSLQWFGLRGSWTVSQTDIFFWSSLAILVLCGSLYEAKFGRKRTLVQRQSTLGEVAWRGFKATSVFVVMAFLWSIWISPSFENWWNLLVRSKVSSIDLISIVLLIGGILCGCVYFFDRWGKSRWMSPKTFWDLAIVTMLPLCLIVILGTPQFSGLLGSVVGATMSELRTARLNKKHDSMQFQGYYEQLNDVNDFNFRLYEIYSQKPQQKNAGKQQPKKVRTWEQNDGVVGTQLVPNLDEFHFGHPFRTNRWGMRDQDYALEREKGTKRVILLGGSISLGRGVAIEDGYEALLEKRLNQDHVREGVEKFEILNFSVGRHGILQRLVLLEHKGFDFQPDIVFFTTHIEDVRPDIRYLSRTPLQEIPFPEVTELMRQAGVTEETPEEEIQARLFPFWKQLLDVYFTKTVELCRARGTRVALIIIPSRPQEDEPQSVEDLVQRGTRAGFDSVIDLSWAYLGYDKMEVQVSPDDTHPNALGHRLLYETFYSELLRGFGESLGLFSSESTSTNQKTSITAP